MAPLDIPSPICMTRSANGPHRIQSGDSATDDDPRLSNFDSCKMPRSPAASLKSPACLRLILNIEFLPNSRHACQIAARVSPVAESGLRCGGKEPVGPLCQHLNANFPVRSLSPCVSLSWTQNCIGHRIRMEMCPTSSWAKSTTKGLQSESKTIEEMCNE